MRYDVALLRARQRKQKARTLYGIAGKVLVVIGVGCGQVRRLGWRRKQGLRIWLDVEERLQCLAGSRGDNVAAHNQRFKFHFKLSRLGWLPFQVRYSRRGD